MFYYIQSIILVSIYNAGLNTFCLLIEQGKIPLSYANRLDILTKPQGDKDPKQGDSDCSNVCATWHV